MKVYKIELLVIDHENMGEDLIREELELCPYVYPSIMHLDSQDVDWTDEHPLNSHHDCSAEYEKLFKIKR
jgi:hypothetical protein